MSVQILESLGLKVHRKMGEHLVAKCPSGRHEDKNPSWTFRVSGRGRGLHYCPSCQWGGNLVGLVMFQLKLSHDDAVQWVQKHKWADERIAPKSIEVVFSQLTQEKFRLPAGVEVEPMQDWPRLFQSYAVERNLSSEQALRWGIGFAATGKLWGRLVLITRDFNHRVCSYMARLIIGSGQRYLYPTHHDGADFQTSFGEEHWPMQEFRDSVVVTEGAFDALAVERAASLPVVAIGGSRIEPSLVSRLSTFRKVFIATDNDDAGIKARNALHASLQRLSCKIIDIELDDGKDPSSTEQERLVELLSCSN